MVPTGPYGSWPSPIDATLAASHEGAPQFVGMVGDEVWWTEPRPDEGGRRALVRRRADGVVRSVLPAPWNVRSRVVEYGGQPWAGTVGEAGAVRGAGSVGEAGAPGEARSVAEAGGPLVVFVNFADQRLYAYAPDAPDADRGPRPLTPVSAVGDGLRWVDPVLHHGEVWCVLEEFTGQSPSEVRRVIAAVPLDGSAADDRSRVRELSDGGHRFVTGPRISPDGTQAAWIGWDHPRMPWDGTEVLVAEIPPAGGAFTGVRRLAGGEEESVCQVEWDRDGTLLFVSDRGGWWELYRLRRDGRRISGALCLGREEEFGGPLWQIGQRWFHPLDSGLIAVVHGRGATALGILDPETGELVDTAGPWTKWSATLTAHGDRVVGVAASPRSAYEVVELSTASGRARVIGSPHDDPVDPAYYPEPQIRTFTGPEGRDVHAHIYPPHHPGRIAPAEELPPYVVWAHGGPTSHAPLVLDLEIAYFTSRGIGVAEVNYGGSTGYGREYRNRLRGQWGVVDVEDCAAVALTLADEGTADRRRLAIRGGSAGGFTTAASLAATDVYACGTVKYPVLDLLTWADETHDLESHYLETLVGPRATCPETHAERSPTEHADRVTTPFLLLQGLDDRVCPPAQAERFLALIAGRGIPHAYIAFEGEGHGFRRADTMACALEAELSLYIQAFGIDRSDVPRLELHK